MTEKPLTELQRAAFHKAIKRPKTKQAEQAARKLWEQLERERLRQVQVDLKQAFLRRQAARVPTTPGAARPNAANASLDGQDAGAA